MATVPMVHTGRVLIATLGDELDDQGAMGMLRDVASRVGQDSVHGVLLDISALETVDSFICKVLSDTAAVVRVLGAEVAVVGMRPAVAITLVELGLPMTGVTTALTVDHGVAALARARSTARPDERGHGGPGRRR
ncbi:MAG: STAS domain-containing protein [Actinomycetes bacterium]